MCPIEGIEAIRLFWFPEDGSVTTVHRYEAENLGARLFEDLGVTTEKTLLEWSYEKGDTRMGRIQEGVQTTVFRRQPDGGWKIWRKMWTDLAARDR
jgi:ketosteroid isomerase-like protein